MGSAQILVVEDEGVVARSIQSDLEGMGYEVPEVASSGEEAIRQAEETHPDLVLMDVVLKGDMDGIEAAERIRRKHDIPIVYLTAYEDSPTLNRAKLTEPFGYLLKPFEERELHATIEMALYKHRLETQLKATERWLATTLRSIADGMIATDARLRVRLVNPAAEQLLGCRGDDVFGKDLSAVCTLAHGDEPTVLEKLAADATRDNQSISLTGNLMLVTGAREIPVEGSLAAISDDGHACGFVLVLRDISAQLAMEKVQRQNELHVRQAQKMEAVARLAGGVAHDFNNLLTVILGNTSLVRAQLPPNDPNAELLAAVETAADRAALRIEQLLGVSGHSRLHLEPLNLTEHLRELTGLLRKGIATRVDIEFHLPEDLWLVQADRTQIAEVLSILCQNAQDVMPAGGRLLLETENVVVGGERLPAAPPMRPGEYVRLRARDTGPGVRPEIRERIYDPYFTTKEFADGRGLGLTLVYRIVEQHRGWIECSGELGQGACFDIYLPRYTDAPVLQADRAAPQVKRNQTTTILLADDEPLLRELGRTILEGQGYQVLLAEDGREALDIFQRERYQIDLVILDLAMPRLSGADACRQLLEIDPGVRILFSSAYAAAEAPSGDDRILGFIRKPYRRDDLTSAVQAALEQVNVPRRDMLLMLAKRLEQALAADTPPLDWLERVGLVLERVEQMLEQHLAEIAAPDGVFADIDQTKQSEAREIERLRKSYGKFVEQAHVLKADVDQAKRSKSHAKPSLRERLRQFVADLEAHRQEEVNLVLESVTTDIGGGD
jgi:two-component system cell cycle sensor histidine kinase/response regulator CckA